MVAFRVPLHDRILCPAVFVYERLSPRMGAPVQSQPGGRQVVDGPLAILGGELSSIRHAMPRG